ncbi:MAG: acyltransferase family protein [Nodosilinea sp.]
MEAINETKQVKPDKTRELEPDILRSAALLYIIGFWHLSEYAAPHTFPERLTSGLVTYGVLGIFCFISGYLLTKHTRFHYPRQILHFYQKRWVRVYPMYLLTLTLFLSLNLIDGRTYLKSFFATNMIYYEPVMTLWFVSLILTLYLLLPLYVYRYSLSRTVFLTLGLSLLFWLIATSGLPWIDHRLPLFLPIFVLGIMAAKHSSVYRLIRQPWFVLICACVLVALVALGANLPQEPLAKFTIVYGVMAISIPAYYGLAGGLAKLNISSFLPFLTYSSFAAYLIHRIVFHFGVLVYQPLTPVSSWLYLVFFLLPLTLVLGYFYQKMYDFIVSTKKPGFLKKPGF